MIGNLCSVINSNKIILVYRNCRLCCLCSVLIGERESGPENGITLGRNHKHNFINCSLEKGGDNSSELK